LRSVVISQRCGLPLLGRDSSLIVSNMCFFVLKRDVKALDGMITGSDEEAALVKAVRVAFPNSRQLYCVLHCQDNVRDYMTKTGIPQKVREEIIRMLFGTNSLALSPD